MNIALSCFAFNPTKGAESVSCWNYACELASRESIKIFVYTRGSNESAVKEFKVRFAIHFVTLHPLLEKLYEKK